MANKQQIKRLIIEEGIKWEGQKEIKGNQGFHDDIFQNKMQQMGWNHGQAWCAYFAELVWKEAYKQYNVDLLPLLDELFHAGAVKTFNNFSSSRDFDDGLVPDFGALMVWQKYVKKNGRIIADWRGHIGVVIDPVLPPIDRIKYVEEKKPYTIHVMEGNTNSEGGREGIEVARKRRKVDFSIKKGLVLKGFIYPKT